MEVPETTASTSNGASIAIAMTFFALLLCLPMIWYVIRVWRPLRVNSSATALRRGWHLVHVTGMVHGSQRHSQTTVTTEYGGPYDPYQAGRTSVRTDVFDTLNLGLADGRSTNVQVVNFNVSAFPGQVVSFWTAQKGSRAFTFAVLNHTTRQQNVNDQQVFKIMLSPVLQVIFVIYLFALVIPIAFLAIFGGAGVPLLLWFVLMILFVVGQRRVRRKFGDKGMAILWRISQAEAQPMMSQQR